MGDIAEARQLIGSCLGAIIYGIVIAMFFKCMSALHGYEGRLKWVLIPHTVTMFSFVTVAIAALLYTLSGSYINHRAFPGPDTSPWSGPIGYQLYTYHEPLRVIPLVALVLNSWLADGLLLYRCYLLYYLFYRKTHWVIVVLFFMYLTSLALGTLFIYESARPIGILSSTPAITDLGTPAYSISLSLNILLTITVAHVIVSHSRKFQETTGQSSDLLGSVVAVLVESCALYTLSFVLYFGPWVAHNSLANLFFTSFVAVQVVAPFLIVLRVVNRTAVGTSFASERDGSIHFARPPLPTDSSESSTSLSPTSSKDAIGETPGELGAEAENPHGVIEEERRPKTRVIDPLNQFGPL